MDAQNQKQNAAGFLPHFEIPVHVLDDLCSRFVINIPKEERSDLIRIFFHIELAYWFYLDFYCAEHPVLKTCGIKDFSGQIFKHCPSLSGHAQDVEKIMGDLKSYKMSVPTYGAIMLDPDMKYCLLVQGFYTKASWGFPEGKINAEEGPEDCAVREVLEETGFDVKDLLKPDKYLEHQWNGQLTRLYIINGVPLSTKFQPHTQKEIKSLHWFPIDALPTHKKDLTSKMQLNMNPNCFFMAIPFVKSLRKWIDNKNTQQEAQRPKYQILNRNGTIAGKPRSLATQFDTGAFPGGQDQWMSKSSGRSRLCPDAWKNFKFDVEPILDCLPSYRRSLA
ncbi:hypothetical protein ACJMK2_043104 [Sinanodonta woodiana]|uniref:m7GpppN-mRNA hydrolase n=1 Tax=Sinanodonta woodiana TaxID=1069815 RepID=A0ABD3VVW2_SINWO